MTAAGVRARPGSARKRKFRDYLRGMSPGARLSWLAGDKCGELLKSGAITQQQIDAEVERIGKAQREVAAIVPSPCRLQDWRDGEQFPPPGKLMRRARRVLNRVEEPLAWPAIYLTADRTTYDVVIWEDQQARARLGVDAAPSSPSAVGIRALGDRHAVIVEQIDLENEELQQRQRYCERMGVEDFAEIEVRFQ